MTQKERLVELLKSVSTTIGEITNDQGEHWGAIVSNSIIADHLLSNGVIVPPCKVGDTVYFIKPYIWDWGTVTLGEPIPDILLRNPNCKCTDVFEGIVCAVMYDGLNLDYFINKETSTQEWISWHKCFSSREEAEQALKERET